MAKGNMLLGQARGKVGDIVFSRTNGQQIAKARSSQVKNPQSQAQMVQRILMNTVIQAYSAMQPITDHSFEGIKEGQDSMSFFMSKNLKLLRSLAAEFGTDATTPRVLNLGESFVTSNPFIIAKGTLPEIPFTSESDFAAISLGSANTYESIINYYGLQRGDQITFIVVDGLSANATQFHYRRVILDPRNSDGSEAPLSSAFISNGEINLPSPRNENYGVSLTLFDTTIEVDAADAGRSVYGRAIIVSRQAADGSWLRSNSQMTLSADAAAGVSIDDAYNNFLASGLDFESALYLNNAKRMAKQVTSGGGDGGSTSYGLTITKDSAVSNATVSVGGSSINSGAQVAAGATVTVTIPATPGGTTGATINGTAITLSESGDNEVGTFIMPSQTSTLAITFTSLNDDEPSNLGG